MIFDCEGDGLYPSKFHVLSYMEDGKVKSLTSHKQMREWLLSQDVLIGHNIRLWDIPHLERVLDIEITATIYDTLFLSWYIFPNRVKYGLEWFGEDYGIEKPKIVDWENLSLEEYVYRCEEDVKINAKVWDHITRDLGHLYGVPQEDAHNLPIVKYLGFKAFCAYKQEQVKWKLDIDFCKAAIAKLEPIKQEKSDALAAVMPNVVKMKKKDPPAKPYKKDGTLSVEGVKWQKYLSEQGLKKDHSLPISIVDKVEPPKPTSPAQIKDWLFSLGWEPCTFKYVKEDDGSTRTIPQIKKLDEPELTDSVVALIDEHPEVAHLEGLSMVSHRLATLHGFLENVDEDGFISAQIQGLTNTLRFKHKVLVNLPGVDKPYGDLIRGCLIARDGKTLIGSDQTSLENTTQRHYMYDYDPEYVEEMNKPGYDSHLDLAAHAGVLTKEQIWEPDASSKYKVIRKAYKKINYSAIYNIQAPKLSRELKVPQREAQSLLDAFWGRNWSIKKLSEDLTVKKVNGQMWLFNPVSKFWYSLRHDKDRFSTLNQGTGVYCFDMWVREVYKEYDTILGQFHDEIILEVDKGDNWAEKYLNSCIHTVNNKLQLNVPLGISTERGNSYADIH